ncbi:hypothetical protein HY837_02620 [archaeon]|nr:hypothetical protein [archaeon]
MPIDVVKLGYALIIPAQASFTKGATYVATKIKTEIIPNCKRNSDFFDSTALCTLILGILRQINKQVSQTTTENINAK